VTNGARQSRRCSSSSVAFSFAVRSHTRLHSHNPRLEYPEFLQRDLGGGAPDRLLNVARNLRQSRLNWQVATNSKTRCATSFEKKLFGEGAPGSAGRGVCGAQSHQKP
jgi:hypothetical protein